jgi:dihydrofolate synthase / folylpolyglutamate synthase
MSDNPPQGRFEPVVNRLQRLHPQLIDLSLDRLERLLGKLGHPERDLPPVIHVAGTNGKGSVCAFLRAIGEAAGQRVHVFTSPHLVHFNERIRLAGTLVDDDALESAIEAVETANGGDPITVFEVIMAAAFRLFASVPADMVVLEVGLGGRFDATNVVARPAACAVASISLDHQDLLGATLAEIAFEKAGIIKPGVPVVTGTQAPAALEVLDRRAAALGTRVLARGRDWQASGGTDGMTWRDAQASLALPPPSLPGAHQIDNAGIAVAAIRAAGLGIGDGAIGRGVATATWPGRLQRLHGRLAASLPQGWELWLDGGHNEGAAAALTAHLAGWRDRKLHLVVGMKQSKDPAGFLAKLLPGAASAWAVAEPGQHLAVPVDALVDASGGLARPGPTVAGALAQIDRSGPPARVLVCGSLYLAGEVLKQDGPAEASQ